MTKKKIMIVDDNDDIRYTIKETLSSLHQDFSFIEASSGKECLSKLPKEKPDLILLDIMMPGRDGIDIASDIRKDDKYDKIKIIFLTAKTDTLTQGLALAKGQKFIEKPFDPVKLDKAIRDSL